MSHWAWNGKVAYIAGPYRADSIWGVHQNIERAKEVARRYWLQGYAVICPHANTAFMDGEDFSTNEMFLNGDLALLERCDVIVMMEGWEASVGATGEMYHAKRLGLEVLYAKEVFA